MQNFPNRVQQLSSGNVASSRIQSPDSGSMTFPTAPGSSLALSKGPSIRLPPELQEEGGGSLLAAVTWSDYSTDCSRRLQLCVSASVTGWVTLSKSLIPPEPHFFINRAKSNVKIKGHHGWKSCWKESKGIIFFCILFGQLTLMYSRIIQYLSHPSPGPIACHPCRKGIMVRSLGLESNDKIPNPDSFFLEVCFPHNTLSHYTPVPLSGNRNNSHKPRYYIYKELSTLGDFPGGPVFKTLCFDCMGCRCDPWSGS